MSTSTRWTIDLVLCDVLEGEDSVILKELFDDGEGALRLFDKLVALNLCFGLALYRQDKLGRGWTEGVLIREWSPTRGGTA